MINCIMDSLDKTCSLKQGRNILLTWDTQKWKTLKTVWGDVCCVRKWYCCSIDICVEIESKKTKIALMCYLNFGRFFHGQGQTCLVNESKKLLLVQTMQEIWARNMKMAGSDTDIKYTDTKVQETPILFVVQHYCFTFHSQLLTSSAMLLVSEPSASL